MAKPHCSAVAALVGALRRLNGTTRAKKNSRQRRQARETSIDADWSAKCENCGESPLVPETGMCGPCTFGEAETAGGNW